MTKPIKFKKHTRFDADKAAKGVAHHIVDENGNDYPVFTTSLVDNYNKFIKVENDRYKREFGNDPRSKGEHANIFAFVQVCVHGWQGVFDEDGKEVPFSKEAAFQYLTDEDNLWFANQLVNHSSDVTNYPHDPEATKEAEAGN